jgi:succinoglycan biosynthesis protein ExoV
MKIFYYQRRDQQPNFGDELNRWLWPQLDPNLFHQDDSTVFVGTGTLLNDKLPTRVEPAQNLVIFSTGAGYEQPIKALPPTWKICCLRGPLSAQRLGLPPDKAITDGGLLIAKLFKPDPAAALKTVRPCFMPHIHSAKAASKSWQRICEQANISYIDPRWPIEAVLQAIDNSDLLLAEAMHGAIAADALRVPWIPIISSPRIYPFKWQDWCAAMALPYRPYRLLPLQAYPRWGRGLRSGAIAAQHWMGASLGNIRLSAQYVLWADEGAIAQRLGDIAKQRPSLSSNQVFENRLEHLQTCFDQLR